ncbi:suppressor of cytokine signaling 1a [Scophthalmus maximus]|nr:suppressor of cytokine signaling 1a [Scophthalmus maximus]
MVADSTVEGHDKTHLSSSASSSSSFSSSSFSSSSSLSSSSPLQAELEQLQHRAAPEPSPRIVPVPSVYLTHFPTFSCKEDCKIITDTAAKLERCGFYWGPLGVEDAHRMLRDAPLGSFLIRDSRQKDVFFTLSYHAKSGPVSVRIDYKQQKFSLAGNERSFPTLFALLEHYINSPKKSLSAPYRKWEPTLQELCRKRIMDLCNGASLVPQLPVTHVVQNFLLEFPYKL